jgi:hypothetical protein
VKLGTFIEQIGNNIFMPSSSRPDKPSSAILTFCIQSSLVLYPQFNKFQLAPSPSLKAIINKVAAPLLVTFTSAPSLIKAFAVRIRPNFAERIKGVQTGAKTIHINPRVQQQLNAV